MNRPLPQQPDSHEGRATLSISHENDRVATEPGLAERALLRFATPDAQGCATQASASDPAYPIGVLEACQQSAPS